MTKKFQSIKFNRISSIKDFPIDKELLSVLKIPEVIEELDESEHQNLDFLDSVDENLSEKSLEKEKKKKVIKERGTLNERRKQYGLNFLPSLYKKFEEKREKTLKNLLSGKCPKHSRRLELLCMKEKMRICTDCALFGDHKNHILLPFKEAVEREESAFGMILSAAIRLKGQLSDIIEENGLPSNFLLKLLQICNDKRRDLKNQLNLKIEVILIYIYFLHKEND